MMPHVSEDILKKTEELLAKFQAERTVPVVEVPATVDPVAVSPVVEVPAAVDSVIASPLCIGLDLGTIHSLKVKAAKYMR